MSLKEELFVPFLTQSSKNRRDHPDLNNMDFHAEYELRIKLPPEWGIINELRDSVSECSVKEVAVLYSDTECYRKSSQLDVVGKFCSFFELHSVLSTATQNVRPLERIQEMVKKSDLVIVLDVSRCPEIVLNHIRNFANGTLILIG